jgi:hypothetical protein
VLFVALALAVPSPVAAAGCDPHASNVEAHRFAYALKTNVQDMDGVRAEVWQYRPFIPFEFVRSRASSAWVMLAKTNFPYWAQMGWYEWSLNYRKTFIQYWNGSSYPTFEIAQEPDNTFTEYKVNDPGSGFNFYIDGQLVKSVGGQGWDPDHGEIASEITNEVNQMAGDYGALDFMWFLVMKRRIDGAWYNFNPNVVSTSNNTKWYASNGRGGMDPATELVTADKRGDCA